MRDVRAEAIIFQDGVVQKGRAHWQALPRWRAYSPALDIPFCPKNLIRDCGRAGVSG
jgi:hypothetical protein